jgi:hypothetical protein
VRGIGFVQVPRPAVAELIAGAAPGQREPCPIEEDGAAIRIGDPDQAGHGFDKAAQNHCRQWQ